MYLTNERHNGHREKVEAEDCISSLRRTIAVIAQVAAAHVIWEASISLKSWMMIATNGRKSRQNVFANYCNMAT